MNETTMAAISAWVVEAGLAGTAEPELLHGFCERCRAAGLTVERALALVDTLHPNFEGRAFHWTPEEQARPAMEYGRTNEGEAAETWQQGVFGHIRNNGLLEWHGRFDGERLPFDQIEAMRPKGYSSLLALVHRFAGEGVFGEMDCIYSYWATKKSGGFAASDLASLRKLLPPLALAIKSISLARVTRTLVEVYLGQGAGSRVLNGKIMRGVAERIDTVLWFSDLRGYTSITDQAAPDDIIPLLNDYADAVINAVQGHGGDVLKLIGDGVLAIFEGDDLAEGCRKALAAEADMRSRIEATNAERSGRSAPITSVYLGLHVGEVFFGNIGSENRLDFTVVGPAVNEVNRIASMCRSADRTLLLSSRFADLVAATHGDKLARVGRYALRGVSRGQDLYTLDQGASAS